MHWRGLWGCRHRSGGRYSSAGAAGKETTWSHFLPLKPLTLVTKIPWVSGGVSTNTHPCTDLLEQLPRREWTGVSGWEPPLPQPPRSCRNHRVTSGPTLSFIYSFTNSFIRHVLVECLVRASECVRHHFLLQDLGQVTISASTSLICKIDLTHQPCGSSSGGSDEVTHPLACSWYTESAQ